MRSKSYGITQQPNRGDSHLLLMPLPRHIAGTHLSTPERWKAELTWVASYTKMVYPQTVTRPSINRTRRRVTTLIESRDQRATTKLGPHYGKQI